MKRWFDSFRLFAVCLSAALVCLSCSDEEPLASSAPVTAGMTISVRATGDDSNADVWMNSYTVVFVEQSTNLVREIVSKNLLPAQSQDTFDFQLGPGKYIVYAFANITDTYFSSLNIVEGEAMPDLSQATYAVNNGIQNNIPMSCRQEIYVSGRSNQNFAIELVRMLAAIRFDFYNSSFETVTLKEITMNPLTQSDIFLIRDPRQTVKPEYPAPWTAAPLTFTLQTPLELPPYTAGPAQGSVFFCFKESTAAETSVTGNFNFAFKVKRNSGAEEEMRYAMTVTDTEGQPFGYINRNDYIVLPVRLTDYLFRVEANFYPPIGGYPTAEVEVASASEFYCKFKSAGDFVLIPWLRRYAEADNWISLDDKNRVAEWNMEITGDTQIFEKLPDQSATGEILGTLSGESGMACVTLSVTVKESGETTRILSCRIYIIQG